MTRLTLALGSLLVAFVVAACSSAPGSQAGTPAGTPAPGDLAIAANGMQFAQRDAAVKAGAPFALWFDNQEGAPHNVSIYDAAGANVMKGDVFGGPSQRVYQVPALAAGTYAYRCDLHPDMTGTLTAS